MVFNSYAKYYDLLYQDKDYKKEIDHIDSLIKLYSNKQNLRILDIGCGTGIHANYLSAKGYNVIGIDLSDEMIKIAQKQKAKNTDFHVASATNFNFETKFDVILSLFHVVSYQLTNNDIEKMFSLVSKHLENNGLFIFDFWYGPAVFTLQPLIKIKRYENKEFKIIRIAEPQKHEKLNTVDVNYEIIVLDKTHKKYEFIHETHKMRYFFIPEIENFFAKCGMEVLNFSEWLTNIEPSVHTWGIQCITKKISK